MKSQKRVRFEKIASKRVERILNTLASLSNCSNKNNYEYSMEDIEKMFKILKEKLKETELSFQTKLNKSKPNVFKF